MNCVLYKQRIYHIKKIIRTVVSKVSPHVVHVVKHELHKHKKYQRYYTKRIKYKVPLYPNATVGMPCTIGYIGRHISPTISHIAITNYG